MASGFAANSFAGALLLLSLLSARSSGVFVGFSIEAREKRINTWTPTGMDRFLERNRQFKILVSNPFAYLDYLPSIGISVDLLVDLLEAKELLQSLSARNYHSRISSHMNISSIIVRSSEEGPPLLLSTLHSIQSALEIFDLDRNIKASALFSLPSLENLAKESEKSLQKITTFLNRSKSFITVEIPSEKGQSLDDGWFSHYMIKKATLACSLLNSKIPIVFKLMNFQADSNGVNISDFMEKVPISIASHPLLKQRVLGLFLHAPAFETVHRELLGGKEATHDTYSTPITVPSTIPTPTIVTVPSTNPAPVLPSNPSPITIPSTNPLPTPVMNPANPTNSPVTIPATNPMPDPVTNPATNPVLSPPVMPVTNPANQPVITSPYSQPFVAPPANTPFTNPGTAPFSPTGSGQIWCAAKSGLPDSSLQLALDYACGMGGADCSAIQEMGSCYTPNTLQAHASYAFNSYFQRNPVPTSCDFGGTAMIVTVNPSTGSCIYPSSSSASGYNPATGLNPATGSNPATGFNPANGLNPATGSNPASGYNPASNAGSGSGSGSGSVLNANSPGGSTSSTVFGSDNPSSTTESSGSTAPLAGWTLLILLLASTGDIW